MYAEVAVDIGAASGIDSLTYEIPDGLAGRVEVGSWVLVPLGTRQAVGFVISLAQTTDLRETRSIIGVLDSSLRLTPATLALAEWMSRRWLSSLAQSVLAMLPGAMRIKTECVITSVPTDFEPDLTPRERDLLERVRSAEAPLPLSSLVAGNDKDMFTRVLRRLESRGVIARQWRVAGSGAKSKVVPGYALVNRSAGVSERSLTKKQSAALAAISAEGRPVALAELTHQMGLSRYVLSALEKMGLIQRVNIEVRRTPRYYPTSYSKPMLNQDQRRAVAEICAAVNSCSYLGHLLFGVTASGKTEVYLQCVEHVLGQGRAGLVLLPEIALTSQVMNLFRARFGDQIAVLHSGLSVGERYDEWARINKGEARVVLGPRSAVFCPVDDLGLIVVDEEHEPTYKQDTMPRYSARDVAEKRAVDSGATLVLGSATPAVETFWRAQRGELRLLRMPERIHNRPLPIVEVVDLREEYRRGKPTIFGARLADGIRARLSRGQQVMLLQNRRAYSTFLLCRECGYVAHCPDCSVSLKLHAALRLLSCHHCDHRQPAPSTCPKCSGRRLSGFGIGTERVEEETRRAFPEARVLRLDRDTTSRKDAHGRLIETFRKGEADILVGTQMIAKGLDFPNVTLVGVISADTSLHLPDFRAAERTFQLISQVAGRAGRGTEPGEVIVQTFDPDHYAISFAVNHDYEGFFAAELATRRELDYPPFVVIANVVSADEDADKAFVRLQEFVIETRLRLRAESGVTITEPTPCVLAKLRGRYRYHSVVRSRDGDELIHVLRETLSALPSVRRSVSIDINPMSML